MKKLVLSTLVLASFFPHVFAAVYFVAVDGNDHNPGSQLQPFATVQRAQSAARPGDTVYLRGGLYHLTETQISERVRGYACVSYLDKSGREGRYICYFGYPGERAVFDYSAVRPADYRVAAFYVTGSWLHLRGFEVTGVQVTIRTHTQSECFENHGSHNIYEQLSMHDGMAIGFYLLDGSNNLILNCDAYRNFDSVSENGRGGNVDGFGCHPSAGSKGNVFRGDRAWLNSDDGYDVINSHEATVFDHCWAFYNGYNNEFKSEGDGNGFKGGGYARRPASEIPDPVPQTVVEFCLAVGNKVSGFYANHHVTGCYWYNNTAYRNHINYNMLNRLLDNPAVDVPGYKHVMRNNLGYKGGREVANLDSAQCDLAGNYFDLGLVASDADFESLDERQLVAPRQADGSLPVMTFMHLRAGSQFIDRGVDIGFPFRGKAPDLGCFESGDGGAAAGTAAGGGIARGEASGAGRAGGGTAVAGGAGRIARGVAGAGWVIFSDDFRGPLDPRTWVAEIEPKPGGVSDVYSGNGRLVLDTRGGVTVWLNRLLQDNFRIEFDRKVVVDTGRNDRLSDLNVFWMATDPHRTSVFGRSGRFESYDSLLLYYVGMGGNTNKTTRFRKYLGDGGKPVLREYLDAAHLLVANKTYHIRIIVDKGTTSFWVDGECFFTYTDPEPPGRGYFGFRSTWSRQEISHFRVYEMS